MQDSSEKDAQLLLNQIVRDFMKEQKSKKRWRIIMRILFILIIGFVFYQASQMSDEVKSATSKPHVGIIDLNGTIMDGTDASSADNFAKGLEKAYKNKQLKALIIRINSPGGSPVQADYMFNTLKYYRENYKDIKTYAVCVDLCASAAYYVAAAADEIYANPSSMVGSIGVVYNGFGFVDAMDKVGITRRLQTAGAHKGFLDPFSPESPEDKAHLQSMLNAVHQQFINRVREGRGSRLHEQDGIFSGLIWAGQEALNLGLIDGFASTGQLVRDKVNLDQMVDYTSRDGFWERVSKGLGTAFADHLPEAFGLKPGFK